MLVDLSLVVLRVFDHLLKVKYHEEHVGRVPMFAGNPDGVGSCRLLT